MLGEEGEQVLLDYEDVDDKGEEVKGAVEAKK